MPEKIPWPFTRFYDMYPNRIFVKWFKRIAANIKGRAISGNILDIGTGPGRLPIEIAKQVENVKVFGIDLSEDMIRISKRNAEKRLSELLYKRDTGSYMKPGKTTLKEYLERWLKEYCQPNLSPRTAEGYQHIIEHYFVPVIGGLPLSELKPEHLQRYYSDKLTAGLGA